MNKILEHLIRALWLPIFLAILFGVCVLISEYPMILVPAFVLLFSWGFSFIFVGEQSD